MADNLFLNQLTTDSDLDGIADGLHEWPREVAGVPVFSLTAEDGGVGAPPAPTAQRVQYTGVVGDNEKFVAWVVDSSPVGSIAPGEPLTVSGYCRGATVGCAGYIFLEINNVTKGWLQTEPSGWIYDYSLPDPNLWVRFSVSIPSLPAGASRYRFGVRVDGVSEGNTLDLSTCWIKVEKSPTPTAYDSVQDRITLMERTFADALAAAKNNLRIHAESLVPTRTYDGPWVRQGTMIPGALEPTVLPKGDGTYEAWFAGIADTCCYASAPALTGPWTRREGTVQDGIAHPLVFKVGSVYHMIGAHGYFGDFDHYVSDDGISWTLSQASILPLGGAGEWDCFQLGNPANPQLEDGIWYMLYEARASGDPAFGSPLWHTGLATATDLDGPWTKYPGGPVFGEREAGGPFVIKRDGVYYCWFHGGLETPEPTDIYRARGTSMYTWVREGAILTRQGDYEGANTAAGQLADPHVLDIGDGNLYMFYEGSDNTGGVWGGFHVDLAIAKITDIPAQLDDVLLKTNTIGSLAVTVTSPVAASGTITLSANDDYHTAHGRSIPFDIDDPTHALGLDDVDASVELRCSQATWTATAVETTGGYHVDFEIPHAGLTRSSHYQLKCLLADGDVVTKAKGEIVLERDIPAVTAP